MAHLYYYPVHNNLAGLQGGTTNEYYHLTSAEYTGSGTGVFARVDTPSFTTPNIGTATGNITGNSGTVTNGAYVNVANSFTKGQTITVANTVNQVGLTVNQNDTTNNPIALTVANTGTGNNLFLNQDGNGVALNIDSEATSATMINADSQNSSGNLMLLSVASAAKLTVDYQGNLTAAGTVSGTNVTGSPTELKLSTASKGGILKNIDWATGDTAVTSDGWIEDAKFGWYFDEVATSASAEFDSAVARTGRLTLKAEAVDATGTTIVYNTQGVTLPILAMEAIPLKVSTVYRLNVWAKTDSGVGASGVYADVIQYDSAAVVGTTVTTNKISASQDWTLLTITFTSDNDAVYGRIALHNDVAGAVNAAWFDVNSMTLEEVVTDTTYTGYTAEKIRPIFQSSTSTDNIDQSLDTGGAYANTYALTNAVNEGATHIHTFTPTKKYITQIAVWPVATGTSVDWTLNVHDSSNVSVASYTVPAASVVAGAFMYFNVPFVWTSGNYHFHLYASATTGTPTCKVNTSNDLTTSSFIQRYAKKTEDFSVITNGVKTQLKSDRDGILNGSIFDLDNAKFTYITPFGTATGGGGTVSDFVKFASDVFSSTAGGRTSTTATKGISGFEWDTTAGGRIIALNDASVRNIIIKVDTILPIKHLKITGYSYNDVQSETYEISLNNVNYTTLQTIPATAEAANAYVIETDFANGVSIFYLKYAKDATGANNRFYGWKIKADIDTSKVPIGLFYPLNQTNQFTETVLMPASAFRLYYRLAKYTNEYGALVPALEFTDTTPNAIGYIPLKLDNSQETNPSVRILSTTTNYQASGTGSSDSGYVLNDGEYMTFTAAATEFKVDYQVGKGTTSFSNITKNTYYLESDGQDTESTQDPSHQQQVTLGVRQQGIIERVSDIGNEIAEINNTFRPTFGGLYEDAGSTAITITVGLTYYGWTTASKGLLRNVDIDLANTTADRLIILSSGIYNCSFSCSAAGSKTELAYVALFRNGTRLPNITAVQTVSANGATQNWSGMGFVKFFAGDYIDLRVTSTTAGETITIKNCNMTIRKFI